MTTPLFTKLPKGTALYHGTLAKWAKVIERDGVDGLYDESFEGWVFYTPKVLRPAHAR